MDIQVDVDVNFLDRDWAMLHSYGVVGVGQITRGNATVGIDYIGKKSPPGLKNKHLKTSDGSKIYEDLRAVMSPGEEAFALQRW